MGRVERMLFNFCTNTWSVEDSGTRGRCIARMLRTKLDVLHYPIVSPEVWRCFYRRHPGVLREAKDWSRTVERLLAQFDAEDASKSAASAIEKVLEKQM
jgi:hypothetical protein